MRLLFALAAALVAAPAPAAELTGACGPTPAAMSLATFSPTQVTGPRIEEKPALELVGKDGAFGPASEGFAIDNLWSTFEANDHWITSAVDLDDFGVCYGGDGSGGFHYLVAREVTEGAVAPEGFIAAKLPARTYAVFTYTGLGRGVSDAGALIHRELLAKAGLTALDAPEVEAYSARYRPTSPTASMEIWVPIAAR